MNKKNMVLARVKIDVDTLIYVDKSLIDNYHNSIDFKHTAKIFSECQDAVCDGEIGDKGSFMSVKEIDLIKKED